MHTSSTDIISALNPFLDAIADRVAARLTKSAGLDSGMISQGGSPLGKRRHCAAVRRRLQHGEHGAAIIGRDHMLSHAAIQEELTRISGEHPLAKGDPLASYATPTGGAR